MVLSRPINSSLLRLARPDLRGSFRRGSSIGERTPRFFVVRSHLLVSGLRLCSRCASGDAIATSAWKKTPRLRGRLKGGGENRFVCDETHRRRLVVVVVGTMCIRKYARRPFSAPRIALQRAKNEIPHREGSVEGASRFNSVYFCET